MVAHYYFNCNNNNYNFICDWKKSVHSEIIINKPPFEVWEVITNTKLYEEWNPVMLSVNGLLRVDANLTYKYQQDVGVVYDIPITVKRMDKGKLLNQVGGTPGFLTYSHHYELMPINNNMTKLIIHEDYRGIAVPFWDTKAVEASYKRLCEAIKARSEVL